MAITHNHPVDELRTRDLPEPDGHATDDRRTSAVRHVVGVVVEPDSYRNIAYLLIGLPLGTLWFTALVTGVVVGVSMLVVALIGIPILLGMWYLTRGFANVERGTANVLLHQHLAYAPMASAHRGNLWAQLRVMSREPDRWHEVGFLLLRFPAGVATFTAAMAALSAPLWLVWAPFHARIVNDHPFGDWAGSSRLEDYALSPWSWLLIPLGLLLLLPVFHGLNGLARACGRWTTSSLTADIQSGAESRRVGR